MDGCQVSGHDDRSRLCAAERRIEDLTACLEELIGIITDLAWTTGARTVALLGRARKAEEKLRSAKQDLRRP